MTEESAKEFLSRLGRMGGSTTGKCKVRGSSEHYAKMGRKSARAKKKAALDRHQKT